MRQSVPAISSGAAAVMASASGPAAFDRRVKREGQRTNAAAELAARIRPGPRRMPERRQPAPDQNRVLNPIRAIDCNAPLDAPFASITPLICAWLPRLAR